MRPRIGVGVFILDNKTNQFLMSKRKDNGKAGLIGGHLEMFETPCECAKRETLEEAGIDIDLSEFRESNKTFNVIRKDQNFHCVDFFVAVKFKNDQVIKNPEPENHEDWEWTSNEQFDKFYREGKLFAPLEELYLDCQENGDVMIKTILSWFP